MKIKELFKKMKYKKLILSAVLVLGIAGVGSTIAILTSATGSLTNTFKTQALHTEIVEEFPEVTIEVNKDIVKVAAVENETTSANYAYIRARLTVSPDSVLKDNDGSVVIKAGDKEINTLNLDEMTVDTDIFVTDETEKQTNGTWVYCKEDGFFYYTSSVAPGNQTEALITAVVIGDASEEPFDITIYEESVVGVEGKTDLSIEEMQKAFDSADKVSTSSTEDKEY